MVRSHCRSDQLDQSRSSFFSLVGLARHWYSGSIYLDRHRSCFLHDNFGHVQNIRVGSPNTNSSGSDREEIELIGNRSYRNLVWSGRIFPRAQFPIISSYTRMLHDWFQIISIQDSSVSWITRPLHDRYRTAVDWYSTKLDHASTGTRSNTEHFLTVVAAGADVLS